MAMIGVSITKSTPFRDSVQEFSNVYHYQWTGLNPGEGLAGDIIDKLVTLEKPLHSSSTAFVRGRVWSAGGTPAENNMIFQKPLTGVGSAATPLVVDKERAYLIRWRAGVDSRGKPVYLRKWFHLEAVIAGTTVTQGVTQNTTGFTTAQRTTIAAAFNPFNPLQVGSPLFDMNLVAPTGRPSTPVAEAHKYLEHHQLGDAWRT